MKPVDHITTIAHEPGIDDAKFARRTFFFELTNIRPLQGCCDGLVCPVRKGAGA